MTDEQTILVLNPLDRPGTIFDLPLLNPNPSSSKTKDGPVYRVSFELEKDDWQLFMDAQTKGMMIAAKACVVSQAEDEVLQKPANDKSKPYGELARELRLSSFFRRPEVWKAVGTDEEFLEWCRGQKCVVCGDGDYFEQTGELRNQPAHVRWVANGSGTGAKPEFSAVTMCNEHHQMQHKRGEQYVFAKHRWLSKQDSSSPGSYPDDAGRDWLDKQRIKALQAWCWETLKADLGHESWSEVPPAMLCGWAESAGLKQFLPPGYRV